MQENKTMKNTNSNRMLRLVISALLTAMTCVATMIIKIPIPATNGYINLGDSIVLLSGFILGPWYGALTAGIGSALADLLSGYAVFAPATFIIKAAMAAVAALLVKNVYKKNIFYITASCLLSELIMITGYFVFESLIMGYGMGALAGVPGNLIQGGAGVIIAMIILPAVKRLDISALRSIEKSPKQRDGKDT